METKTIAIGCDHAGFPYKEPTKKMLKSESFELLGFF